jgi:hypothetical protein
MENLYLTAILIFSAILFFAQIFFYDELSKYIIRLTLNSIASRTVYSYNCSPNIIVKYDIKKISLVWVFSQNFYAPTILKDLDHVRMSSIYFTKSI